MAFELDREQHRDAWAAIEFQERRRIIKAVNRGEALESARDARLAVGVATNQMRFWRWAWILGPMGALFQLNRGLAQVLFNAVFATVILGGLSYWFHRRAARSRDANLAIASGGRSPKKPKRQAPHDDSGAQAKRRPSTPPGPTEKFAEFRPAPNTSRAKAKRRKKRR